MKYYRPRVFISGCIENKPCRYDGHMITSEFVKSLKEQVDVIHHCPEVEIGLGVPREAIRLAKLKDEIRLIHSLSGIDVTDKMKSYSNELAYKLKDLDGFLLKSRSPSCGIKQVKIYKGHGKVQKVGTNGIGLFAERMMEAFPNLIFEDEGRLTSLSLREHFLTVIYVHAQWRNVKESKSMGRLVEFQSMHKYLFMMFNQSRLKNLGKLVANHDKRSVDEIFELYDQELDLLLLTVPSIKRQKNMLLHVFGYFSEELSKEDKAFFLEKFEQFSQDKVSIGEPLSILETWTRIYKQPYLLGQSVFAPFPKELKDLTDSKHQKH